MTITETDMDEKEGFKVSISEAKLRQRSAHVDKATEQQLLVASESLR